MKCPRCGSRSFTRFGFSHSKALGKEQRFRCRGCRKTFLLGVRPLNFRDKKKEINQALLILLCSGVSQRRLALGLSLRRHTVARKIRKYGKFLQEWNKDFIRGQNVGGVINFDEMQSFEHTKCKPLSIPIAVEEKTRLILGIHVVSMPANGLLAKISRKKYGPRKDERHRGLISLMADMKNAQKLPKIIKSDKCPRYPGLVKKFFPLALHKTYKGRRGCIVGQGELKRGGFDPLFSLNHSCAMVRDSLKRTSRRTWCTTKKASSLELQLNIYMAFHNRRLALKRGLYLPSQEGELTTLLGAS